MTVLDHLSSDLEEHVSAVLRIAYFVTLLAVILAAALFASARMPLLTVVILLIGSGISFGLRAHHYLSAAAMTYIGALLIAITALIIDQGLNDHYVFLFLLPVIAASALLTEKGTFYTAILACAMLFGATGIAGGIVGAIHYSFAPMLMCLLLAAMNTANTRNLLGLVEWAVTIQGKDTQRAEAFFAQREELAEALLKLQHAKSALEQTNRQLAQTNLKLEEAEHVALQASQAKSIFMSNMSHELRTPLNVIIGYSSSMLTMPKMFDDVPLPLIYHEYVHLIEESGQYLLTLINDILDLSKIEASKLSLYPEDLALPPLLKGVIATSIGLVKDKPILIRPSFNENLPQVYADPTRVRQILLNLMSNAIKFTTSGSVTLSAVFDSDVVRISVSDTGIGIPEHALEHIFDRYQQAERDTDKSYGGTGLGLDISKQLCLMHGGDLVVKSTVGRGSTFTFTLPLTHSKMAAKLEQESAVVSGSHDTDDESYLDLVIVLLVEDQASLRETIRKLLEKHGYYVLVAQGSQQSIEMADALLPSLIILDIDPSQPDHDHDEIFNHLSLNPDTASIPVVLCTSTPPTDIPPHVIVLDVPTTPTAVLAATQQLVPRKGPDQPSLQ
jgi:signal transduction histidine kinase